MASVSLQADDPSSREIPLAFENGITLNDAEIVFHEQPRLVALENVAQKTLSTAPVLTALLGRKI
jgi:hypothetical protein